jgi:hypothetical protein
MGLTTASVGTCGVVFSQINDLLFGSEKYGENAPFTNDSTYHFLIFLSLSMASGILFGSFFLGPIDSEEDTVVYQQIIPNADEEQHLHHSATAASDSDSIESSPLLDMADLNGKPEEEGQTEISISGWALLRHPIGFGLFSTLFVVLGIGYVYLANIGQILNAVSKESSSQHARNVHITLFSLGNCGSRAFFGALSDVMRNKLGIHRLWIFMFAIISMLATLTYLVSAPIVTSESLLPCTLVISTAYGIVFGVAPATTTELGTKVSVRMDRRR